MTCPTNSVPVDPSTNRLLPPPYAYDANGNMTNDGTNTLAYDAASQLITSTNGGNAAAYVYDGHGIRIRKCAPNCGSPASSTIYIFSGSKVIAEYDNGAAVASPSREYIYSGAQLLAKSESGALTYYHSDHLSNRATTDSSGNVLAQRAHYPFGETWYESGTASKLKFTTYERDSETGDDFAMARYAVSGLGRFSSPDALAGSALAPQSMNRFSYVQNDPINIRSYPCLWLFFPDGSLEFLNRGAGNNRGMELWHRWIHAGPLRPRRTSRRRPLRPRPTSRAPETATATARYSHWKRPSETHGRPRKRP